MKRDMDFIRELLIQLEAKDLNRNASSNPDSLFYESPYYLEEKEKGLDEIDIMRSEKSKKFFYHYKLLVDGNFLLTDSNNNSRGLSWAGCDFLDSVRDDKVWENTKKAATHAGGFSVDLLKDIAKGFLKKQVEEYSGIKLP